MDDQIDILETKSIEKCPIELKTLTSVDEVSISVQIGNTVLEVEKGNEISNQT